MKVGITGDMGSGKSYVCGLFEASGIPVYYTDLASKRIMSENDEVKYMVKKMLKRPDVYHPDGSINKELMRHLLFAADNADENRGVVSLAIASYIQADYDEWIKKQPNSLFTILESAILFESGFFKQFDKIIYVTAPRELRIKRAVERDGITEDDYYHRMKRQLDEDLKKRASDFVIENDGFHDMKAYVDLFTTKTTHEILSTF